MTPVEKKMTLISALELKRLLTELKDKRPDICIRYRILGEMWKDNFFRIHLIRDSGAIFHDMVENKLYTISDLSTVMQFELDAAFQNFQPHYHYDVMPSEKAFT